MSIHENRKVYTVVLTPDETGVLVVTVKEVPGCITQASNRTEALVRVREALSLLVDDADAAHFLVEER